MDLTDNNRNKAKDLLLLAALTGKTMLRNGAETYRVEDTMERICKSRLGIKYANAFVTPTGIFLSLEFQSEMLTYLIRIKSIKIDLNKIDLINEFSRQFVNSRMTIREGLDELHRLNDLPGYKANIKSIFGALASAFFALLFGGGLLDLLATYLVSLVVLYTINKINQYKMTFFINNIIGALTASILSILAVTIGIGKNMDIIIIGSIMPLVPGVSITNALRDTMSGDFVSGLSRGMEAIFSALAIAFGVGVILNIYYGRVF